MSREIKINKYEGNTHYSVHVVDSFNQEHHIGYYKEIPHEGFIHSKAEEIWQNEVKREVSSMDKAIANMIEIDKKKFHFTDSMGNHRDGLD